MSNNSVTQCKSVNYDETKSIAQIENSSIIDNFPIIQMLDRYCDKITSVLTTLEMYERMPDRVLDHPCSEELLGECKTFMEKIREMLIALDMRVSLNFWHTASTAVSLTRVGGLRVAVDHFRTLRVGMIAELKSYHFYYVPARSVGYYDKSQFSARVYKKFPGAVIDMQEAGKCFALGRNMACVIHLMRVLEVGLKKIHRKCKVKKVNPNWDVMLTDLGKYVDNLPRPKRREQIKLRSVLVWLAAVKDAWRNKTMHVERDYSEIEAKVIFGAVVQFMDALSVNLR
jgi:hypothetical protein